jgi:predicted RNase H-like HicB family nuclease
MSRGHEDKVMKFKVQLYHSEEGVAVCAPSLPGCWSQGATEEEALANIAVAIREYLEAEIEMAADPETHSEVREVEVSV